MENLETLQNNERGPGLVWLRGLKFTAIVESNDNDSALKIA